MKLWKNRPLFAVTCIFMGAALTGFFLAGRFKLLLCGVLLLAALLGTGIHMIQKHRGRRVRIQRAVLAVCFLLVSSIALFQSFWSIDRNQASADAYVGGDCTVMATVKECRGHGGQMSTYALDIHWINGKVIRYNGLLTCYYVAGLQPGDTILLDPEIISLSEACGDIYEEYLLMGDGIFMGLVSMQESDCTMLSHEPATITSSLSRHRIMLSEKMEQTFGDEAFGLPSALLLGERGHLGDDTQRDFSRAGVSHLLAISGLHMTMLFGLLAWILQLFHIPPRMRAVILGIGALAYLIYLGFPPSATRAVIMLGMTYLSTLCFATADPLTSLGLAGAGILFFSPISVADIGFWMSFSATLGLLTFLSADKKSASSQGHSRRISGHLGRSIGKLGRGLLAGFAAVTFSLWVVAPVMGEFSILSPVTTLLLTPLVGILLILVPLTMLTLSTPLGEPLLWLVQRICGIITHMCQVWGKPSWVVVSLRHGAVPFLAVAMILATLLLLGLSLRKKGRVLIPMVAGWLIIGVILGVHGFKHRDEVKVSYLVPSTAAEMMVMTRGREAVILEISNGSHRSFLTAAQEATKQGATEISALVLTDYHSRTSGSLLMLLRRETVRVLWMPRPTCEDDYYLMLSCLEMAEKTETPVVIYEHGQELLLFGDMRLTVTRDMLERSVQPVLLMILKTPAEQLTFCGRSIFESRLALPAMVAMEESDTVIFSNKGPVMKAPMGCIFGLETDAVYFADRKVAGQLLPECYPREGTLITVGQGRFSIPLKP